MNKSLFNIAFSLIFSLILIPTAFSQTPNDVTVIVSQPPYNELKVRDLWNIKLKNNTTSPVTVYLYGTLVEAVDGTVCTGTTSAITLQPNVLKSITTGELEPISYTYPCSNNKYKQALTSTGGAPDGEYDICVVAKTTGNNFEVGSDCKTTTIVKQTPPELISPADDDVVLQQNAVFSWIHIPPSGISVKYKLKIVEIIGSQSPDAAMTNNQSLYQNDNITNKFFNYPSSAQSFVKGKKYAWQVSALSGEQLLSKSDVWSFTYNSENVPDPPVVINEEEEQDCQQNVQAPAITNTNLTSKTFKTTDTVRVGLFKMILLEVTTNDGMINGKGSILVRWLRTPISVLFTNVKVNSDNRVFDGKIVSELDESNSEWPKNLALNQYEQFDWTQSLVKKVNNFIHNVGGKLVKNFNLEEQVANNTFNPVKLPLGFSLNSGQATLAITEMRFDPTSAKLTCVTALPVDFGYLEDTISLGATNILFSKRNPNLSSGKLGLISDLVISKDPGSSLSWELVINKISQQNQDGTYVEWGCNGFDNLTLNMDIKIPRNVLLPKNYKTNQNEKAKINFKTVIHDFSDWIVSAKLDTCIIPNTNGFKIALDSLYYDHSDSRNPENINFPNLNIFDGNRDFTFREIYIPNAKIILPDKFRTFENPNQKVTIIANDIIVNKNGLYCDLKAFNVIQFPKGDISGLGASIDTVKISIKQTSILNAYIKGKILLPVCDGNENALGYKASFNTGGSVQFVLKPDGNIKAKFFNNAALTIDESSYMSLVLDSLDKFDFKLNGNIGWNNQDIADGIKVKIGLDFQNLSINYDESKSQDKFTFSPGTWSLASPPKWLANFPISVSDVKVEKRDKADGEFYRGALTLKLSLALDSNRISASTKLAIIGVLGKDGKKFQPDIKPIELDSMLVNANLSAVKINGYLVFYRNDQNYGNGFGGGIKATFKSIQIEAEVECKFGTKPFTNSNTSSTYRYWFVRGKVIIPKPGIVFMSGLAFYGFGAGAWKNMSVSGTPTKTFNESDLSNATEIAKSKDGSGYNLIPVAPTNQGSNWGFSVTAVIGATPEPKTFNADATLTGDFSGSGGLNLIRFDIGLWCMAELTERSSATVSGKAWVQYKPPEKIFDLGAAIFINTAVVTTPDSIRLYLHINGKNSKWFFTLGTPSKTNSISVAGINFWEYLMFGNDFEQPTNWNQYTINGFQNISGIIGHNPLIPFDNSGQINSSTQSGRGFAIGIGAAFDLPEYSVWALLGDAILKISGGVEIDFSLLKYKPSCGYNPVGLNNWYCKTHLAAWGIIDIDADPYIGGRFDLITLAAYASCVSGFPNPYWFDGSAGIYFKIFKKGFSTEANFKFGTRCEPEIAPEDSSNYVDIIYEQEDAVDEVKQMIRSIRPSTKIDRYGNIDYINPDNGIFVSYNLPPDMVVEIDEQQSNGTTKTRKFKAIYEVSLDSLGKAGKFNSSNMNNLNSQGVKTDFSGLHSYRINVAMPLRRSTNPNFCNEYEYKIDRGQHTFLGDVINFSDSTMYKFTVLAKLYELYPHSSGKDIWFWRPVKDRLGRDIFERKIIYFNTNKSSKFFLPGSNR